jgi:hypothetical protein
VEDYGYNLHAILGYETKRKRDERRFVKTNKKLQDIWNAHNVDSHCICEILLNKEIKPVKIILKLSFIRFHRRQLHRLEPGKHGERLRYGGTMSLGLKRGSLVKHKKHGLCYVGGYTNERLTLHCLKTGIRISRLAKVLDCLFKTYLSWRPIYVF